MNLVLVPILSFILEFTYAAEIVTDSELQTISENLLFLDENNVADLIKINYQNKTTTSSKTDESSEPLLDVSNEVWKVPTIEKHLKLIDNYEWNVSEAEKVTDEEISEEDEFIEAVMATPLMQYLMDVLSDKGYVSNSSTDQAAYLKELWFSMFPRQRKQGVVSSSAFEHVFLSEHRKKKVLGMHNWIYFALQEKADNANYLGYLSTVTLMDKGSIIRFHFTLNGVNKPISSMFIGTSPEFDMAAYTLCFVTRPNKKCNLKFSGNIVPIQSFTLIYNNEIKMGTVYVI